MDDENASCAHEEDTQLSLQHLPVEIFLHICSFLETSTLVHNLSLVCKQFYLILKNDSLWKKRINHMWPDASYPLLRPARPDKLFWKLSCIAIEKQTALWKRPDLLEKLKIADSTRCLTGSNTLLQMHDGTTYLVGARYADSDSNLIYWKLPSHEKLPSYEIENSGRIHYVHHDLIIDIMAIDNMIYSCSSDMINSWMLMNTGLVHQRTYEIAPNFSSWDDLQCVSTCPECSLIATGSKNGNIFIFDSRSEHMLRYRPHNMPIFKLAINSEYILSCGWNKMVSIWDRRAGRTMKSITFPDETNPTCMSIQQDYVLVGDSAAKLHVLNPKNDFELVKSYSTEHTRGITGVQLTHGCLITSSTDGTVRISSPTDPPKSIATLFSGFGSITRMEYLNSILMMSHYDYVAVLRPKWTCSSPVENSCRKNSCVIFARRRNCTLLWMLSRTLNAVKRTDSEKRP